VDETVIGNSLSFTFTGKVSGDTMSGDLDMGEYLSARWSARRYQYRQAG
jgi:L-seryl-tRNA(Ser) seleniumtransferase